MASPNLSELIASTLRDRQGKFADNVSKGNVILSKLKEKGAWESAEGRTMCSAPRRRAPLGTLHLSAPFSTPNPAPLSTFQHL